MNEKKSTPIEEFLKNILLAYERNGIRMSLNKIENNIVYLNIDKRCGG
jgi:hypothetical protein